MTKTVNGSFIVDCEYGSHRHKAINTNCPIYKTEDGERIKVCVIQVEYVPYKDSLRAIYELVEV